MPSQNVAANLFRKEFMTRERLYRAYIEELKFFNPELKNKSTKEILANYKEVSAFKDLFWFDLYDGPEVVGFILVVNGEHCTADADYLIMETYVHPNYRGRGICFKAVEQLFKDNLGNCGLFILNTNKDAHKFWKQVFGAHSEDIIKLPTNDQYDNEWCRYYLWAIKDSIRIKKEA